LIAFPTDTVYGVACDLLNVAAINRLYEAKSRDRLKALPLLLAGPEVVSKVALQVPASAELLGEQLWPGALTLVVNARSELPPELGGGGTIAVRVPDHDELRAFLAECGGALATSSANVSGQPDAVTAEQAASYLGDWVAVVVDGGRTRGGVPSTVVDCTGNPPVILRAGAIPDAAIWAALGQG
jgi:L-threonylcarbamoyladenylate synthase